MHFLYLERNLFKETCWCLNLQNRSKHLSKFILLNTQLCHFMPMKRNLKFTGHIFFSSNLLDEILTTTSMQGQIHRFWKKDGALCRPPWLVFLENISIFIYNQSLPMKCYQSFKIHKWFDKERDKTLMRQSMRKEKLKKVGLCFTTSC